MDDRPNLHKAAEAIKYLRTGQGLQDIESISDVDKPLHPQIALLRAWQAKRLAHTYADFFKKPRYASACTFFLTDIYAPHDFSERDQDLRWMRDFLKQFFPARTLHLFDRIITLNTLSNELDEQLRYILFEQMAVEKEITPVAYAESYRIAKNYTKRVEQITLIVEVVEGLSQLAGIRLLGVGLKMARQPAYQTGLSVLYDFLEKAYTAFKKMGKKGPFFAQTIQDREMVILDNIYAELPNPFGFEGE